MQQITADGGCVGAVGLNLQSEWNALFAAVLASSELGTDAVDADENRRRVASGVPHTLERVDVRRVRLHVQYAVRQRYVCAHRSAETALTASDLLTAVS